MKKVKELLLALTLLVLLVPVKSTDAGCQNPEPWYYVGHLVPYYESGEEVGQQCVWGGTECYCIGKIYYY